MDDLARWNRSQEIQAIQHGLASLWSWSPVQWPGGQEEPVAAVDWTPLVDICADDREYVIQTDLPEVQRDDVTVTATKGALTIKGERKFDKTHPIGEYILIERRYGKFARHLSLPEDANPASVSTEYIDGVFTVRVAKKEKGQAQLGTGVDGVTAWWQERLGKKAVLGPMGNPAPPGSSPPVPTLR